MNELYSTGYTSAKGENFIGTYFSARVVIATATLQGLLASGAYKASPVDFVTDKAIQYADSMLNKLQPKK